ncbi:peptide-binding protein, partial [Fischerella thermalis WC559]
LMQLVTRKSGDEVQINRKVSLENLDHTLEAFRQIPILNSEEIAVSLSQKQQSEILDNFFSKQMPSNSR